MGGGTLVCVLRFTAGPARLQRLGDGMQESAFTRFTAVPVSPTIGAELSGVDLRQPVDEELFEELHRALLEWKVLFFRDQDLTSGQHVAFSRLWGELEVHPFLAQGDVPGARAHLEKARSIAAEKGLPAPVLAIRGL